MINYISLFSKSFYNNVVKIANSGNWELVNNLMIYKEKLYDIVCSSYKDIQTQLSSPDDIGECSFGLIYFFENEPVSFIGFKKTQYGDKIIMIASENNRVYKNELKNKFLEVLQNQGIYCEVSDKLEEITKGLNTVNPELVSQITGKPVKIMNDRIHYERMVTNIGPKVKKMIGNPNI